MHRTTPLLALELHHTPPLLVQYTMCPPLPPPAVHHVPPPPLLQYTRMHVLDAFRGGAQHVLVATDVAARGLDIKVSLNPESGLNP